MSLIWSLLAASKARSSHCAVLTHSGRLLLYSGELSPRIPVDGALLALDIESQSSWHSFSPSPALTHVPQPRVGATAVYDADTNSLYVWGGRGGVDMAPLDRFQAGVWRAPLDTLDTSDTIPWERLPSANDSSAAAPAPRSYHASVLAAGKLYVHAGCPASGRLAALHAFDLATNTWHNLADAPAEPRGGTAIAAVTPSAASEPVLIRFGGFAGVELPRAEDGTPPPVDVYTPSTDSWSTVRPAPDPDHGFPGSRSVHGLVPWTTHAPPAVGLSPIALLYHGERSASPIGHAGAGVFWNDAWLLLATPTLSSLQWKKLRVDGKAPEGRGWFPPASYVSGGKTRIVLAGGLLSSNERSGEVWVGDVEL